jgi:murein L,D-transpeptidase YcbB/YkuD
MTKFFRRRLRPALPAMIAPLAALASPLHAQDASSAPVIPPQPILPAPSSAPVIQPLPGTVAPELIPVREWEVRDAKALLQAIEGIGAEGLTPADYKPDDLRKAIDGGKGADLDQAASRSFAWLAEDLRDGRTPMESRKQWFVVDPDVDLMPTATLLDQALATHDVPGVLASLDPTHPDYAVLKRMLAQVPAGDKDQRAKIRANMDRWRWLARDLGATYLLTNVPEFQLRLTVNHNIIRSYRTVVGKPGSTATPQLAEVVEGVIFNPTWTVPQSIVKGEGLGARLLASPARAKAQGYKVSRGADGVVTVVQQPGPNNALGLIKLDMPNPHAIFLHDTPGKDAFNLDVRALSHGCIRTERALEMGMTMAILGGGVTKEEAVTIANSGEYTKVALKKTFPVYITYFTMAQDIDGKMRSFADIYGRDAPVLASFNAPRQLKTGARTTGEAVVPIEAPGA